MIDPRYLFHGTSLHQAQSALKDGLSPRGQSEGNWPDAPSRSDCVYLTTAYALHYACACAANQGTSQGALLKIDRHSLSERLLLADEDALEQAHRRSDGLSDMTMLERAEHFREKLEHFREKLEYYAGAGFDGAWSLKALGNCAHMGLINPESIVGIAAFDTSKMYRWSDPSICLMNYRILGPYYDALHLAAFGMDYNSVIENAKIPSMIIDRLGNLEAFKSLILCEET